MHIKKRLFAVSYSTKNPNSINLFNTTKCWREIEYNRTWSFKHDFFGF